jgi:hypothetical protein
MKTMGWILLSVGYIVIVAQLMNHDPPSKIFAARFASSVEEGRTFRGAEVRKLMGQLAMGISDRSPWILLPATLMLAGAVVLACMTPTKKREGSAMQAQPGAAPSGGPTGSSASPSSGGGPPSVS